MCGVPPGQKALAEAQTSYYSTLTANAQQEFAEASGISKQLEAEFAPIFAAGPNQFGFSPEEMTTLNADISNAMGEAARSAVQATTGKISGEGGGNEYVPQGANKALVAGINTSAAEKAAGERVGAVEQGYTVGRENWLESAKGLETAMNPYSASTSAAGTATSAGSAANQTETAIAEESSSWLNLVSAGLGAAATLGSAGIKGAAKAPAAAANNYV